MTTSAVRAEYGALLKEKRPHAIRTRNEHDAYLAEITSLLHQERLDAAHSEYLDLLVTLTEAYERQHVKLPKAAPLEVLRELMDARGMKQADLVPFTGSSGLASEICNGKRPISTNLARKLAQH